MSNVLRALIEGQRIRYQVSKVTFNENDLLKANAWRWGCERNAFIPMTTNWIFYGIMRLLIVPILVLLSELMVIFTMSWEKQKQDTKS